MTWFRVGFDYYFLMDGEKSVYFNTDCNLKKAYFQKQVKKASWIKKIIVDNHIRDNKF